MSSSSGLLTQNGFIGTFTVNTFSNKSFASISINSPRQYFYLLLDKLYLTSNVYNLTSKFNSFLLDVSITDLNDPPGIFKVRDIDFILIYFQRLNIFLFKKYFRIEVENEELENLISLNWPKYLCNTDSNRLILNLSILDLKLNVTNCQVSNSNNQDLKFNSIIKLNQTEYEVYLPKTHLEIDSNLLIEFTCFKNGIQEVSKQTVDFEVKKCTNKIKDILGKDETLSLQFDWIENRFITKLEVVDSVKKPNDTYGFYATKLNSYLEIGQNGNIFLKKQLDSSLLKYSNPKLSLNIRAFDKYSPDRYLDKKIEFKINITNKKLPYLRFKPNEELGFGRIFGNLIPIGRFELDENKYPKNRFVMRLNNNGNFNLDDDGNLIVNQDPIQSLKNKLKYKIVFRI